MKLNVEIKSKEGLQKIKLMRKKGININAMINLFLLDLKI